METESLDKKLKNWFKDNYCIFILLVLEVIVGYAYTGKLFGVFPK
jgi:predicted negative regulator of RcsB-dependent stress response